MSKTFKIVGNDISDGYHTFDELYEHRVALFVALCSQMKGRDMVFFKEPKDGWFIVFLELSTGQISYHLPEKYLPVIERFGFRNDRHQWDGHTSPEVLDRLNKYVGATP